MQCPNCGLMLDGNPANCPRCGQALAQQQQQPGPWGQSAPPSVPFGAYPPSSDSPYGPGQAAPPSMPLGTPPPPAYPGYPPGYPQPQPYPPGYAAAPVTTPFSAPPPRRRNTTLIVVSVVSAVIIVVVCAVGLLALSLGAGSGPTAAATATSGTASATATAGPAVLYENSLLSPAAGWTNDQNCSFKSDGYHIKGFHLCFAPIGDQADISVRVQMEQINGTLTHPHGIAFRHNSNPDRYEFDIDAQGSWVFFKCLAAQQACVTMVDYRRNSAIHRGLHVTNILEVQAKGTHFTFSVNGTQVGTADDDALADAGAVALVGDDNTEVVFSQLTIKTVAS
ncbi:MAG TPA: hypothetical protein VFU88_01060 [Ktedonobacterales bacterium]|nr:hypothetical protein [Ktedonobacterales bacterium]